MKFYIVDAFTEVLFGGNPAGVVLLDEGADFPAKEHMVKTAAELRYSETAFIKQLSNDEFNIRYFTPVDEVELCGHATIGSFAALLAEGRVAGDGRYTIHTLAGSLAIQTQNGFVMMEMAAPKLIQKIDAQEALSRLYSVMGLSHQPVIIPSGCSSYMSLLPMIISTGLPDILLPVATRDQLSAIRPDFSALSDLSEEYDVVGVHAFTLDRAHPGITAHCRNFAPLYDIDEESATGTANGALTYYLYASGLISPGKEYSFVQGESMNRPSKILSHLTDDGTTVKVQVGGTGVVLASGAIFLP